MVLRFLKWHFAVGLLFNLVGLVCIVASIPSDADFISYRWHVIGAITIASSWMGILMSYPYGYAINQKKVAHAAKMLRGEIWSEPAERPVKRERLVEALVSLGECNGFREEGHDSE